MYRWFLAYKYVFRLITLAALLGVTYSVTVLIVVVSVMEGFRTELETRIRSTTSDIRVESTLFVGLEDPEHARKCLESVPGIRSTAPVVETLALFRRKGPGATREAEDRLLIALDVNNPATVTELDGYIRNFEKPEISQEAGPFMQMLRELFEKLPENSRDMFGERWLKYLRQNMLWGIGDELHLPAILGSESLRQRQMIPGDPFELTSFSPVPPYALRTHSFFVVGYFKTGLYELDARGIILRLEDADRFLELRGESGKLQVSGLRIRVDEDYEDEDELIALREEVERTLDDNDVLFVKAQTWREKRDALLQAVRMEKTIISIILGVVILFAGFMIFIILTVQVIERARDIGVLQSIGTTPRGIATIYFLVGSSLCLLGTVLGTIYGVGFARFINTIQRWIKLLTGYEVFPPDVYYLDKIPVSFKPEDLFFIIIPTVAASLIASLVPALRAAKRDPAISLRYE